MSIMTTAVRNLQPGGGEGAHRTKAAGDEGSPLTTPSLNAIAIPPPLPELVRRPTAAPPPTGRPVQSTGRPPEQGSMGIRCDFNRSACGLVAAALLLSPAFAASQPRLVEVPQDGWDTSAEWQGVDDVEVEVDWPPGLPPGVAAAGVSPLLYCILCEQGYSGAVSITSTIRAQASDWRESTQTVTLSCGEGETSEATGWGRPPRRPSDSARR